MDICINYEVKNSTKIYDIPIEDVTFGVTEDRVFYNRGGQTLTENQHRIYWSSKGEYKSWSATECYILAMKEKKPFDRFYMHKVVSVYEDHLVCLLNNETPMKIDIADWRMLQKNLDIGYPRLNEDRGYVRIWSRTYQRDFDLHRLLCPCEPGLVIDHINRDKLDNRRCNLRQVTKRENWLNSGPIGSAEGELNLGDL